MPGRVLLLAALTISLAAIALYPRRSGTEPAVRPSGLSREASAESDGAVLESPPTPAVATSREFTELEPLEESQSEHQWEEAEDDSPPFDASQCFVAHIEDAKGLPVTDAEVSLYWRRARWEYFDFKGKTDSNGDVQTPLRAPFQIEQLSVVQAGTEQPWSTTSNDFVADSSRPRLIRFRLVDEARLRVNVSLDGQPSGEDVEVEITHIPTLPRSMGLNELRSFEGTAMAVTDAAGAVEFAIDAGVYEVEASDASLETSGIVRVAIAGGTASQSVDLALEYAIDGDTPFDPPTASVKQKDQLTGRVVDAATGAPIPGAKLSITQQLPKQGSGGEPCSDATGRYHITGRFKRDRQFVFARAKGYAWAAVPLNSMPDGAPITLAMEPERRIEGRAVDEEGAPVGGWASLFAPRARVGRATSADGPQDSDHYLPTAIEAIGTGPDGRFRFDGAIQDLHRIFFQPYDPKLPPGMAIARSGETNVVIRLGDLPAGFASVGGVIRDKLTGAPVPNIRVRIYGQHTSLPGLGMTDAEGRYEVAGLEPGPFRLDLEHQKEAPGRVPYAYQSHALDLEPGAQEADFSIAPARVLQLQLLGDSPLGPLRRARVSVLGADGAPIYLQDDAGHKDGRSRFTDWNGRVNLFGVPAEEVQLQVWLDTPHTGEPTYQTNLDATQEQTALITLRY